MKTSAAISCEALKRSALIPADDAILEVTLELPAAAKGMVVFAYGKGSSRLNPQNQFVAEMVREAGMGTLTLDLLTPDEERQDAMTFAYRFNVELLARRLVCATRWLEQQKETRGLRAGYFGADTVAGAALVAAVEMGSSISAIVSGGGRPDLGGKALQRVKCPTLLLVGGHDDTIMALNEAAYSKLRSEREIRIVHGATHRFEEPGKLEQVAHLSVHWFDKHVNAQAFQQAAA